MRKPRIVTFALLASTAAMPTTVTAQAAPAADAPAAVQKQDEEYGRLINDYLVDKRFTTERAGRSHAGIGHRALAAQILRADSGQARRA